MGLKKANYKVEKMGIVLPEAYAIIHDLEINGDKGRAKFYIQNSPRANAIDFQPFEYHIVAFDVDRGENPFTTAYNKAKEVKTITKVDPITKEETVEEIKAIFADWEDDIVEE